MESKKIAISNEVRNLTIKSQNVKQSQLSISLGGQKMSNQKSIGKRRIEVLHETFL